MAGARLLELALATARRQGVVGRPWRKAGAGARRPWQGLAMGSRGAAAAADERPGGRGR